MSVDFDPSGPRTEFTERDLQAPLGEEHTPGDRHHHPVTGGQRGKPVSPDGIDRSELGNVTQCRQPGRHVRESRHQSGVQQLMFRRQRLHRDTGDRHLPGRCPHVVEVELESADPTNEGAVDVEFAFETVEHRDRLRESAVEARSQLGRPPPIAGFRRQHAYDVGELLDSDQQIDVVEVALLRVGVDGVRQRRSFEQPMVELVRLEDFDDETELGLEVELLLHQRHEQRTEFVSLLHRRRDCASLHRSVEQEHQALVTTEGNELLPLVVTEWSAGEARIALDESVGGDAGRHVGDVHGDPAASGETIATSCQTDTARLLWTLRRQRAGRAVR